ncbi:metal cation symporter ZIP14-like [Neocloeon triangulifer]|uniref:metal cation symporter ZIP14-like n=1 Tax=Neocloeon triangulifer TaxID=2078957 RepID=UPI00286F1322|nr:metal cation symporter ZIP14-like [Neocloeon triangulifer]
MKVLLGVVLLFVGRSCAFDINLLSRDVFNAKCENRTCLGEIQCSALSELRGKSDTVLLVEPISATTIPSHVTGISTESITNADINYTSSPIAEVTPSTEEATRQKRNVETEKCFLVYNENLIGNETDANESNGSKTVNWQVWLYGFLSVGFISLSGIFGVVFVPLMKKKIFEVVLRYLVGLGIGALSSTAIFQLIPECFEIMDRDYLSSSVVIWMTIWVFFVFESVCKIVLNGVESHHGHSHSNRRASAEKSSRPIYKPKNDNADIEVDCFLPKSFENGNAKAEEESKFLEVLPAGSAKLNSENKMAFHHRSHDFLAEPPRKGSGTLASISSVAWMIILGDGIHNFIDGVSIGAGFTQSPLAGCSISLAIIFEEFPHELGDFAILISSGMSVKKALAFNFASACTAFLGLVLGISLESFQINSYIFGLAGGLFLYISLSDLIPQLNNMLDEALEEENGGKMKSTWILIQQNLGILTGMVLIYLITRFGHLIQIGE